MEPKRFSEMGIKPTSKSFVGDKVDVDRVMNKEITVLDYRIEISKFPQKGNGKCLWMQIKYDNEMRVLFSGSGVLMDLIEKIDKGNFPFITTIVKENKRFLFT